MQADSFGGSPVFVRGPKAEVAAAKLGWQPITAGPLRTRGLLEAVLDGSDPDRPVACFVDGRGSAALVRELRAAGRDVHVIRAYRSRLPADTGPAEQLVHRAVDGELDVTLFTSPVAVTGMFTVAAELGLAADLEASFRQRVRTAAIGAATAEQLEVHGVVCPTVPLQPRVANLLSAIANTPLARNGAGGLHLDAATKTVRHGGVAVVLTELEFALAAALVRRCGSVTPPDVLVDDVWGANGDRRRLEVLMSRLRRRLGTAGITIRTVPKRGYRLELGSRQPQHV